MSDKSSGSIISLPKGGGAVKGIGETFQANQFTGTGNFTIPIPVSPGRAGFGPSINLQYSSGTGNGPFGLGWEISIPRVTRKTERGLPKYNDDDVFVLSGAEDLVVRFVNGTTTPQTLTHGSFAIRRYHPRTEGLFVRVEKWVDATGDAHWRATTKDNITSIYGRTPQARIFDSADPRRTYEWLLEETFDAKGNHIHYEYAADDPTLALRQIYEEDRRYNQRYIRRICYGNLNSEIRYPDNTLVGVEREGIDHRDRVSLLLRRYVFEIVFDYGDGGASQPGAGAQELFGPASPPPRADPFSSFRAGFEVRTVRRCERVLMYHHFAELGAPSLVRSTRLDYTADANTRLSLLASVTVSGHSKTERGEVVGDMPPVAFKYSDFQPHKQRYNSLEARGNDLPAFPLSGSDVALVDLFGDGLPDVLHTSAAGFRYWKNLGNGLLDRPRFLATAPGGVTLAQPEVGLADVDGDGRLELLLHHDSVAGYYEAAPDGSWENFRHYHDYPSFSLSDPNLRMVDLTGDGRADVLVTRDHHFLWFECRGENGYSEARPVERLHSLDDFPDVYFNDPFGRLRLADMNGDGLADIVLLHNGRADYWPNLGYGKFGERITMGTVPDASMMDATFDPKRLFLVDLDGTGCADLVYVEFDRVDFWFNQSGNTWSARQTIRGTPLTHNAASLEFADIFGTGTATLLWSYAFGLEPGSNYKALDFCGGVKPYVLIEMDNNMGATTRVRYAPSTKFAVEDRQNGHPWVTHLPFPVHVVEKIETIDHISKTKLVTAYKYHHGYFDGREREFRGFGRVDRLDTELFEVFERSDLHGSGVAFTNAKKSDHLPPVLTKAWHHTGAHFSDGRELLNRYRGEFYAGDPDAFALGAARVEAGDSDHEAHRALRGAVLRTEIYALDGSDKEKHPYLVTDNRYAVRNLQRHGGNARGVYFTTRKESLTHYYERNPTDPRVAHDLTLAVDDYGNATDAVAIAYPRRQPVIPEQAELAALYTKQDFINLVDRDNVYYAGVICQSRAFEVKGVQPQGPRRILTAGDFDSVLADIRQPLAPGSFLQPGDAAPDGPSKRLGRWTRTYFRSDASAGDLDDAETAAGRLPLGGIEPLGLPYETYTAAFNPYLAGVFGSEADGSSRVGTHELQSAGYRQLGNIQGYWWIPSGRQGFDSNFFFQATQTRDPFGAVSRLQFDPYALLPVQAVDALTNQISAVHDYHVLQPVIVIDPNGAKSMAAYDALGLVAATALQGHSGEGDSLEDVPVDLSPREVQDYFDQPLLHGRTLLGSATSRVVYDLHAFERDGSPLVASSLAREQHVHVQRHAPIQYSFVYSDGLGRAVQTKARAEPGRVPVRDGSGRIALTDGDVEWSAADVDPRWVASGWAIFNNKGKPLKQFEPFFTDTHKFEYELRVGVSPAIFYDPLGRVVATLHPNRTYEKAVFDAWRQETWDANDTATSPPDQDPHVGGFFGALRQIEYAPTWYEDRISGSDAAERRAAQRVEAHAATPTLSYFDSLGRTVLTVGDTGTQLLETRLKLDIFGNELSVTDPRGVRLFEHVYDLAQRKLVVDNKDAGLKYLFADVADKSTLSWDANENRVRMEYDLLQRPSHSWVRTKSGPEFLAQQISYGESKADPEATYHRARVYRARDGAGEVVSHEYDYKGNLLLVSRVLTQDFTRLPDWNATVALEPDSYWTRTVFDALNRIVRKTEADGSSYEPTYNKANLLEQIQVTLPEPVGRTPIVTNIDYNAKGQRTRIDYANGVTTACEYDRHTFRLRRIKSDRAGESLQDLRYTYDPVGNITEIYDAAFDQVFNNNALVEPATRYVYDGLYRLTEATGREHTGLTACADYRGDKKETEPVIAPNPQPINNSQALRNYRETFRYDLAGNLETVQHAAGQGSWTRVQAYETTSNRLVISDAGCAAEATAIPHDPNGNITKLPHLGGMRWDHANRLVLADLGGTNNGRRDTAHYGYSGAGVRVRKVVVQGLRRYERIYLGALEIYREYRNDRLNMERRTLHVLDNQQQRVALIEARTDTPEPTEQRFKYQLGNHLGSSMLELDGQGRTLTYEEYYPYGGTAYMAGISRVEVDRKRYRYSGKERDDETGLCYYGARYYAPWLGRWVSCDPQGKDHGINVYMFVLGSVPNLIDRYGLAPNEPKGDPALRHPTPNPIPKPQVTGIGTDLNIDGYLKNTTVTRSSPQIGTDYTVTYETKITPKSGTPWGEAHIKTSFRITVTPHGNEVVMGGGDIQTLGALKGLGTRGSVGVTDWIRAEQLGQCLRSSEAIINNVKVPAVLKGVDIPNVVHDKTVYLVNVNQNRSAAFLDSRIGRGIQYQVGVHGYDIRPETVKPRNVSPGGFGVSVETAPKSSGGSGGGVGAQLRGGGPSVKAIGAQVAAGLLWGSVRVAQTERVAEIMNKPHPLPSDIEFMEYMGYKITINPDNEERVGWIYDPGFERRLNNLLYDVLSGDIAFKGQDWGPM